MRERTGERVWDKAMSGDISEKSQENNICIQKQSKEFVTS